MEQKKFEVSSETKKQTNQEKKIPEEVAKKEGTSRKILNAGKKTFSGARDTKIFGLVKNSSIAVISVIK